MTDKDLGALEAAITDHAALLANNQWHGEHQPILMSILEAAGVVSKPSIHGDYVYGTLTVNEREIPIEVIIQALRLRFLERHKVSLKEGLIKKLVEQAGRKIWDEDEPK